MVRPTDQETTTLKRQFVTPSPNQRESPQLGGHTGKHQVSQEAEGVGENVGKSLCFGFCGKKGVRQGSRFRLG